MTPEFWKARWEEGQIGFHQPSYHNQLMEHWPGISPGGGERVLVPLCGKSLDLIWLLKRGHRVVGVEISPLAVADFFAENGLSATQQRVGPFTRWRCDEIELLQGDLFQLTPAILGEVDAIYDRASLIALPPEMRVAYAERMAMLTGGSARTLLLTLEYDQQRMAGPPFSVSEPEVRTLYGAKGEVTLLAEEEIIDQLPRFRELGLDSLIERTYRIGG